MAAALIAVIITPLGVIADEFLVDFNAWMPGIPPAISNGLLPAVLILSGVIWFYLLMKKRYDATNNDAIQSVFVLLLVAFIVLTITCMWFRGAGMKLMWLW